MSAKKKTFEQPDSFVFTPENKELAAAHIAKYPKGRQRSAVMPLLDLAQRQNGGWLPTAAMDYIADFLNIPPVNVYEVATFYTMYNLEPVGKHHVQVCTNISCWLRGADEVVAKCRESLGINFGETTDDGMFTLSEVECLGACVNAPMMQIDDDYYEDLEASSVEAVLAALKNGSDIKPGPQSGRKGSEPAGGLTTLKEAADSKGRGDA